VKNTQQRCEKNLINSINLMIHYNHIENLPKEVCDDYLKEENKILTLLLYVNDLLIFGNYVQKIDWIKKQLQKKFDMLDFG